MVAAEVTVEPGGRGGGGGGVGVDNPGVCTTSAGGRRIQGGDGQRHRKVSFQSVNLKPTQCLSIVSNIT